MENTPIYGCTGCSTTGGRMSCYQHGYFVLNFSGVHHRCNCGMCHEANNNWDEEIKIIENANYRTVLTNNT